MRDLGMLASHPARESRKVETSEIGLDKMPTRSAERDQLPDLDLAILRNGADGDEA